MKYHIFYDGNYWRIGSMEYMDNNLICVDNIKLNQCDKWYDGDLNRTHYLLLNYDRCKNVNILDIETISKNDGSSSQSFFQNKIKITFYSILAECCCLIVLCIYCKRKRNRINGGIEQLQNSSSSDDNMESHVAATQFKPITEQKDI